MTAHDGVDNGGSGDGPTQLEPGPDAVDLTPNQDGGVLKEILTPGIGEETPTSGDEVFVHYVGRLAQDGSVFDSSRERGEPFSFKLDRGSVIKGWDIGVAQMKQGEKANLYCKADYAYGDSGSPPKIPPNATLVFEVELLKWMAEDISPKKDGGIQRRQHVKGEGYSSPDDGAVVEIHLIGRYNGTVFEERDVTFPLGEGSENGIVEGVEKGLEKFKKGERSTLKLAPQYAFGSAGKSEFEVPANAIVDYEITLNNFEKAKKSWELDGTEKIEQGKLHKEKGTKYFKDGKYDLALKQYLKAVEFVDFNNGLSEEEKKENDTVKVAAHLNIALCYLKIEDYPEALKSCEKVLEFEPKNEKALFRRGQANMGIHEYESAKGDFQAVQEINPENKAALSFVVQCEKLIKKDVEREKQMYSNIFQKMAAKDKREEELRRKLHGDVLKNPGTWGDEKKDKPAEETPQPKEKLAEDPPEA